MTVLSADDRDSIRQQVVDASQVVAQSWPLKTFAYRNPLRGLEHLPFDQAVRQGQRLLGGKGYLPNDDYFELYQQGEISDEAIDRAIAVACSEQSLSSGNSPNIVVGGVQVDALTVYREALLGRFDSTEPALSDWLLSAGDAGSAEGQALWVSVSAALDLASEGLNPSCQDSDSGQDSADLTLSDWAGELTGQPMVDQINDEMIKWSAAFLDEGISGWSMPDRKQGFFHAWRGLATSDWSCRLLGIKRSGAKIRELPEHATDAVASSLQRMRIPKQYWTSYLSRHLAQLPGWTGFIRWRGENPDYLPQQDYPIDAIEYLAVRLFYEVELVGSVCKRQLGIDGTWDAIAEHAEYTGQTQDAHATCSSKVDSADSRGEQTTGSAAANEGWRLFQLARSLDLKPADIESLSSAQVETLVGWVNDFPSDRHGAVWLEALETTFRDRLLQRLSEPTAGSNDDAKAVAHGNAEDQRPVGQFVFCIDVRSEPMRRRIESAGSYQTFGFAGFFGIPISYQGFDQDQRAALCPVILSPGFAVDEVARPDERESLESYAASSRWVRTGDQLMHDLKQNPISSLMSIDVVGIPFAAMLAGKTFFQASCHRLKSKFSRWASGQVATTVPVEMEAGDSGDGESECHSHGLPQGFSVQQQAAFVEGALRAIGLTSGFGKFVIACGHGSTSDNNPYAAAYNCGACGGGHGDANARVFARMANSPDVRQIISDNGIEIPADTCFVAAKHDTVTDTIAFYDVQDVPVDQAGELQRLIADIDKASDLQTHGRVSLLPESPGGLSPEGARAHMVDRSVDWANVRPEWGLSGNAAFILGRRGLTDKVDLDGRVFLQSYDPNDDDQGGILEALMTAPLVVAQWISMEYYFSAVDPQRYGSGSKVTHNLVAGVGVMHGAHGDLQAGLPLQSVNDGAIHYHRPVRLLAVVESPTSRIETAVSRHEVLQHLLHNQWIHLVAVDPDTGLFQRYCPDASWETLS